MDEYQELFKNITIELSQKRKELPNIKEKIERTSKIIEELDEEIKFTEEKLDEKKEQLEVLPNKNNNKIFYKFYIPGLLLTLIPSSIMAFLTVKLIIFLSSLNIVTYILLGILSGILGIIIPAFTGALIIRKIFLKKLKKSKEEIISSPEYQKLSKEIKFLENDLSIKKGLQKTENNNINDAKIEHNIISIEINMKEALLKHLKSEGKMSSKVPIIEEQKEDIKAPKRVLKKD